MSELERPDPPPEENDDATAGYAAAAVGVALLVGAILLIITTGTPIAGLGLILGGAACLGWGVPQVLERLSKRLQR